MPVDSVSSQTPVKKVLVLHPFFITLFPILFLFAQNLGDTRVETIFALSAKILSGSIVIWAVMAWLSKNGRKSGLILSLFILLFSSYGHFAEILRRLGFSLPWIGRDAVILLIPAGILVFIACTYFIVRSRSDFINITRILNLTTAFLVIFPAARITTYEIKVAQARQMAAAREGTILKIHKPAVKRNIYYIILDAHGRSDVLKALYDYDDTPMISHLKEKGFFVASKSRANYSCTLYSLASSLNFDYLDAPTGAYDIGDWVPTKDMIAHSKVSKLLKDVGYRFVSFDNAGEVQNADFPMSPWKRSEFADQLLRTTAAVSVSNIADRKRREVLYPFECLPETADAPYPVFVFAHIMAPHRPFVFAADGSDPGCWGRPGTPATNIVSETDGLSRPEHIEHYRRQIAYVDTLLVKTVDAILAKSRIPPIIVIQGDHGPEAYLNPLDVNGTYFNERMSILNAYYLPDGGDALLYDDITPVNTFRLIFNYYFGADCPMLVNESFFAVPENAWQIINVTDIIDNDDDRKRLDMLRSMDYFPPYEPPALGATDSPLPVLD